MIALVFALAMSGQIMGNQTQILGGEDEFFTLYPVAGGVSAPVVTMTPLAYTRTVTCTGAITIAGTATNTPTSVTWAASPDGASGSCTGTSSWSCAVSVSPNAAGEGVETITITATNAGGNGTSTVDVGFYVTGAHSCFLSQSVDGLYNSTLANNDPVTTWENLGSSALDVTQSTGSAKPTYKTSLGTVSQPFISFDGGDSLLAATASDWNFLTNTATGTAEATFYHTSDNGVYQSVASCFVTTSGFLFASDFSGASTGTSVVNFAGVPTYTANAHNATVIHLGQVVRDTSLATDITYYKDGSSLSTLTTASLAVAQEALKIGDSGAASVGNLTGYILAIRLYSTALSITEMQINEAVDEWALSGTFPVTP